MTEWVYLAGPMSSVEDWNIPQFFKMEQAVEHLGYRVLNPARTTGDTPEEAIRKARELNQSWTFYMKRALRMLLAADAVLTLPGWSESKGATLEVDLAKRLEMPIYHGIFEGRLQ